MTNKISAFVHDRLRRPGRTVLAAAIGVSLLCVACIGGTALFASDNLNAGNATGDLLGCGGINAVNPSGNLPPISGLIEAQIHNAAVIISVGQELHISPRGWVIAIATALQESRLTNLPNLGARNDHDSIGLFQQRPSQGWGTVEQLSDPAYQTKKFFSKLVSISGWQGLPLTVAAQRVQVSAYPNAYAKHEPLASQIVDSLTGGASRSAINSAEIRCTSSDELSASGWIRPLKGPVTSGFRTSSRPRHNGVDIAVPKGTPIRATNAGIVLVATCNAHIGRQAYSCDRDGGVWVQGCGWYIDLLHANNVITRYCHQLRRPYVSPGDHVTAGQVIGLSGSSGNSSGPHLHFEVHIHGDSSGSGATDPVPFMHQVGASLSDGDA